MKKTILLVCWLCLALGLAARTLILPLAVDTKNHASSQWLGKAVSFYLIAGLGQNSLPVCGEEEVQEILNCNLIRFPFAVTKATAMVLARENQADRLLWGEILYSEKKSSQMQVQLFLIDIGEQTQKQLPLAKGNVNDMYRIQAEALKAAVKAITGGVREAVLPQLNLSLPDYEKLIKSLLLGDNDKKLELLLPLSAKGARSDSLNFELAKIYLEKRDLEKCEAKLNLVADTLHFKDKKDFLLALVHFLNGSAGSALTRFIGLQKRNAFPVATHNNLGVIYLGKGDFAASEKCLRYALYLKKDPKIYFNLILLLQAMDRTDSALQELPRALQMFPDDEKLLKLFSFFLAASENKETLGRAFADSVPFVLQEEQVLPGDPLLMNPLEVRSACETAAPGNLFYVEARNLFLESDFDGAMQKVEEAMESNPFQPENHHLLALLFMQKKQYIQADMYAQSALFLEETLDNYLLQIKIYQAQKEKEKSRKVLVRALQKFPQDPELLKMSGR
jgi:tetratricopeptide (TPR) repeat protein